MSTNVFTTIQKPVEGRNVFSQRMTILAFIFGCCFLVVIGRLWQLQITCYEKYHALATRDNGIEKAVTAMRGPILDRNGDVLAEDRPYYDLSVRVGELKFESFDMKKVSDARLRFKDDNAARDAEFDRLASLLDAEPFVKKLAQTLHRDEAEISDGLIKAIDAVTRTPAWASDKTPLRIMGGIDEKIWQALRATQEDVFRAPGVSGVSLPFPGLACTLSMRRVYPHGKLACFVLGTMGEMTREDEEALKQDGVLFESSASRNRRWQQIREELSDDQAVRLERVLKVNPQEVTELVTLYTALNKLRPQDLKWAAEMGLSEPVRWMERPPRIALTEPELLWMGVGLPATAAKKSLPNRIVGETGIERWYNDSLRGKAGLKIRGVSSTADESLQYQKNYQPQEGNALALTLSLTWQRAVEKALAAQEYKGAIVVLDVKNGDVLALASQPGFDPNLFSPPREGKERLDRLRTLLEDEVNKPLLNRAIAEQYPLGSVMKSIVAAIALEKGLVTPDETFTCPGYLMEGKTKYHCDEGHSHGSVNLFKAIRCSCNVTFYQIGARIGVESLSPYARQFFGRRSGIELSAEAAGIFPDQEWRLKAYPNNPAARIWTRGNDYHLAIGQGQFSCTVVQAAQMMAAIASDGTIVAPRLSLDASRPANHSLGISSANLALVRKGLEEVANVNTPGARGTAYAAFHEHGPELAVRVAGKTSTAEHGKSSTDEKVKSHAWFVGYAPADHPQVAFAVLLEEAGHGGSAAAPVVYNFLKEIYGTRAQPVLNPGGPK